MINVQHILFDNSPGFFNIQQEGIIKKETEKLYIYFRDNCNSNSLSLIGDRLEWKPEIWFEFEKENFERVKEINIICLRGDLSGFTKHLQSLFPYIEFRYHPFTMHMHSFILKHTIVNKDRLLTKTFRQNSVYSSIGHMRLNRYILTKHSYNNGYGENIFHPEITQQDAVDFEYAIKQCNGKSNGIPMAIKAKRLFDKPMEQAEFNQEQVRHLSDSYAGIVAPFPNSNWVLDGHCEKYFNLIMCKTIPLMLCVKNSNNRGCKTLGFLPYVGLNFDKDSVDDYVQRWQGLLEDNYKTFSNEEKISEIYEKNYEIIEENFSRLVKTDWDKEKNNQYSKLPNLIKDFLKDK